jgi:subtilase family serine protease
MWWWPWHHEVTVCADATDWVAESNETNNCRTETNTQALDGTIKDKKR